MSGYAILNVLLTYHLARGAYRLSFILLVGALCSAGALRPLPRVTGAAARGRHRGRLRRFSSHTSSWYRRCDLCSDELRCRANRAPNGCDRDRSDAELCAAPRACLASVRSADVPAIELIVVDNDSVDDTRRSPRSSPTWFSTAAPERSAQRTRERSATGEYLFFVDSDMVLEPDVVAECVSQLRGSGGGCRRSRGQLREAVSGTLQVVRAKLLCRGRSIEAARFFPADVIAELGGFDETLPPGPEDWDLHEASSKTRTTDRPSSTRVIRHDEGDVRLVGLDAKEVLLRQGNASVRSQASCPGPRATPPCSARIRLGMAATHRRSCRCGGMFLMKTYEFAAGAAGFAFGKARRGAYPRRVEAG